jgi:hypothetical protein
MNGKVITDATHLACWQGSLQYLIPELAPDSSFVYYLPVFFTSRGSFTISYTTEEVLSPDLEVAALAPPKIVKGKVVPGVYVPDWSERTQWGSLNLIVE